jgi:hypothetical protein
MINLSSPVTGLLVGGVLTVAALAMTPAQAHADPTATATATDYGIIHADAVCAKLTADPTMRGVGGVWTSTQEDGLSEDDAATALHTAAQHGCPNFEALVSQFTNTAASIPPQATQPPPGNAHADADEASFFQAARATGLMPTNPKDALVVGYEICDEITANGVAGVANAEARGHTAAVNSGMPMGTSGTMIRISVYNLCPKNTPAMDAWIGENPQEPQTEPALPTVSDNPPQADQAPISDPPPTPGLGNAAGHAVPQPTLGHAARL